MSASVRLEVPVTNFAAHATPRAPIKFGLFNRCSWLLILLALLHRTTEIKAAYTTTLPLASTTAISPSNLLPYFDFDVPRNLTVTVGQTGFLHCRVERLGDKDVSWIRKRDLHILTAGSTTYTSDQRFQVIRPEGSVNWTLQIKYPQPRDSGIYECQINTEPKMSLSYTFNVVELKAEIIGPSDLYVKSGSDINLTCKIMQGPHELGNIFWYKGNDILDLSAMSENEVDSSLVRVNVENDWSDGLTSRLKIRHAVPGDTGNYTCVPTIAKTSSVYVHVIIGEHPAAMQHNSSSMNSNNFYSRVCCILFTIFTCCLQHFVATVAATTKAFMGFLQKTQLCSATRRSTTTAIGLPTTITTTTTTTKPRTTTTTKTSSSTIVTRRKQTSLQSLHTKKRILNSNNLSNNTNCSNNNNDKNKNISSNINNKDKDKDEFEFEYKTCNNMKKNSLLTTVTR